MSKTASLCNPFPEEPDFFFFFFLFLAATARLFPFERTYLK
jgi:hypothetical protein